MMSNKLVAEMYELQQKGAKGRTPKDRFRLEQLKLKKAADDARQKELELKARIGEDFLRHVATQSNTGDWLNAVVNETDRWYADMLVATYREEEKKAAETAETDDENQDQSSSETAAGVQQDQAQA